MARRRSLNRRWSRRSGNTMDLNPDSELIDEENPAWWKNLEETTVPGQSAQASFADVTEPILSASSLINESDIHDRWWDNLDRTSLQSSRRFSTRKSINPEDNLQDSVASENTEDVSIKKQRVLLRARRKQSGGTETFLRAFNESDVARSEPGPSKKRKTQSPAKSETDVLQRKNRVRHSRSLADVDRVDTSGNSSVDTDVVVKARPKAFKRRITKMSTGVRDETLTEAGPSGINSSKNASTIEAAKTPSKAIDSNESGFMGPSVTGSHRKRLSTISKKLDMSSDDSEPAARKPRLVFRQKPSINPFDDILSGQLNESSASAKAMNNSGRSSNATNLISKSLRQSQALRVSTVVDDNTATSEISTRESQWRQKERTANEETIADEEEIEIPEKDQRSSSAFEQNSRVSKRRTENAGLEETAISEWYVPETQDDTRVSRRRTKNSTIIVESMDLGELPESQETNRGSSVGLKENLRRSKSRGRNATIEETIESDVPETQEVSRKSTRRSKSHGRNATIEETSESDVPGTQEVSRKSTRRSKSHGRNTTIEETSESDVPGTQEASRKSTRRSKNSTANEESAVVEELPEARRESRRSSSVSKKNSRISKGRRRHSTISEATMEDEDLPGFQEKHIKSTSKDAIRDEFSKGHRSQSIEQSILPGKRRSQRFQDWNTSGSEVDDVIKPTERSSSVSHQHSMINKTLEVSIPRLSSTKILDSHQNEDLEETEREIRKVKRRSRKSQSRVLADSAYELPDKDRSASVILSMSESESPNKNRPETSTRKSPRNKSESNRSARESVSRSIRDERAKKSRKSTVASRSHDVSGAFRSRNDSAKSGDDNHSHEAAEDSGKYVKNRSAEKKSVSRKSIPNTSAHQGQNSDQSISEELAVGSWDLNASRRSSRLKRKADDSKKATESRLSGQSEKSISEEDGHRTHKSNLNASRRSSRLEKTTATPANASYRDERFGERTSDVDLEIAEASEARQISPPADDRANASRKSYKSRNVSRPRLESDESISEGESIFESIRKSSVRSNYSRQRMDSDESIDEQESHSKSANQPPNVSRRRMEPDEIDMEDDVENQENTNPALGVNRSTESLADISRPQDATNRNKPSSSTLGNIHDASSTTIPSEPIPLAPNLTKLPQNSTSFLRQSNVTGAQKNITDFFQSKSLQRPDTSKAEDSVTSVDKERLELMQKVLVTKKQELAAMRLQEAAEKKQMAVAKRTENFLKAKKVRTNVNVRKETAKPPKVVDKAYIVNGQVYKRPKLPRPKPWVTDRLYRHLWKKMEPKYNLRTRVKSESFVEQLAGVVALTIRRKKYDSYKAEVDALMKEMARLDIIKTRNDFYDFCYDYLPYDFRVKVTPMLLPGNIRNIPYDPATLHTPILPESR